MNYPFVPKSTSYLEPGQYWPIPLSNGAYACGVVLSRLQRHGKMEKCAFFAGLLDWYSQFPPDQKSICECSVIKCGALHIKAISEVGAEILGKADFKDMPQNPTEYTDDIVTLGYSALNVVAESRFVNAANKTNQLKS